jgi:hypothetical protein
MAGEEPVASHTEPYNKFRVIKLLECGVWVLNTIHKGIIYKNICLSPFVLLDSMKAV